MKIYKEVQSMSAFFDMIGDAFGDIFGGFFMLILQALGLYG